jgi:hypothetical protein
MKRTLLALAALMFLGGGCVVARPYPGYYGYYARPHYHYRGCGHYGW